jgi:hypothetical protein
MILDTITIQFNLIIYLRANLTAQRPITKLARVRSTKVQKYYKQNKSYSVYIVKTIIIIPLGTKLSTTSVVYWSEFLAADPEVRVRFLRYQIF